MLIFNIVILRRSDVGVSSRDQRRAPDRRGSMSGCAPVFSCLGALSLGLLRGQPTQVSGETPGWRTLHEAHGWYLPIHVWSLRPTSTGPTAVPASAAVCRTQVHPVAAARAWTPGRPNMGANAGQRDVSAQYRHRLTCTPVARITRSLEVTHSNNRRPTVGSHRAGEQHDLLDPL
jgi:hypothetical protein